jgi:hypothetical protein
MFSSFCLVVFREHHVLKGQKVIGQGDIGQNNAQNGKHDGNDRRESGQRNAKKPLAALKHEHIIAGNDVDYGLGFPAFARTYGNAFLGGHEADEIYHEFAVNDQDKGKSGHIAAQGKTEKNRYMKQDIAERIEQFSEIADFPAFSRKVPVKIIRQFREGKQGDQHYRRKRCKMPAPDGDEVDREKHRRKKSPRIRKFIR